MGRQAIVVCFLVLVLGAVVFDAGGIGDGGWRTGPRFPAAGFERPYGKVCPVGAGCDLGQGVLTVTGARYADPPGSGPGGSLVAVEFAYEYEGGSGSVDVRRLPFVLEDEGGGLHGYEPSLTREYAESRGLVLAYGDGDGGYGTVHYGLSMRGAAVFAVPAGLGEDLALHAADVVDPASGDVARIELTP